MNKLYALVFAGVVFLLHHPLAAQSIKKLNNDTVIWQAETPLVFTDFKGKVSANKAIGGQVLSGILLYTKEIEGLPVFVVEAIFIKSKSFIRDSSLYALNHEQMHFNITEIFARQARKKLLKTNFAKISNVNKKLNDLYKEVNESLSKYQELYDNDTEHGTNFTKQKMWNEKILAQLQSLSEFADINVNTYK